MDGELNSDGNLKNTKKEEEKKLFQEQPCIKIIRRQISSSTPLRCKLKIQASKKLENPEKIESIFKEAKGKFRHMAEDLDIEESNNEEYIVNITSGMYRCEWCNNFRKFLGKELNVKVINQDINCNEYIPSRTKFN